MTVGEIKKLISDLPNDFLFEIEVSKKLSREELENSLYPYPYKTERCSVNGYDIGHQERKIKLDVETNEL